MFVRTSFDFLLFFCFSIVPIEEGTSTHLVKTISMTVFDIPSVEFPGQIMGSVSYGESFIESAVRIQRPDDRIEIDGKVLLLTGHIPRMCSWPVSQTVYSLQCTKKSTIHQVTTMLATSKNILFPGHNHLLTTSADNPTL